MVDAATQMIASQLGSAEIAEDLNEIFAKELKQIGNGDKNVKKVFDIKQVLLKLVKYASIFLVPHFHYKLILTLPLLGH